MNPLLDHFLQFLLQAYNTLEERRRMVLKWAMARYRQDDDVTRN